MQKHPSSTRLILIGFIMLALVGLEGCVLPQPRPSYAEILKTYPKGTTLCKTVASVVDVLPDGNWQLSGTTDGKNKSIWVTGNTFTEALTRCYGVKITAEVPVTLGKTTYQAGTKFTVDRDLKLITISGW